MSERCPHCGAELPLARDAFCPMCRGELDDVPSVVSLSNSNRAVAESVLPAGDNLIQRPLGIGIFAILHFAGGILTSILQIPLIAKVDELEGPLRKIGLPLIVLVVGLQFLVVLTIASGVGMWLGKKWGWWFGAFYHTYGVARNVSALLMIGSLTDELTGGNRGPGYYYAKHMSRVIIHVLILLYFFKPNVLCYFGLQGMTMKKAIPVLVGICLVISGIATVVAWLPR